MSNFQRVCQIVSECGQKATRWGGLFETAQVHYGEPPRDLFFYLKNESVESARFYDLLKRSGFHSGEWREHSNWYLIANGYIVTFVEGDIYIRKDPNVEPDDQDP